MRTSFELWAEKRAMCHAQKVNHTGYADTTDTTSHFTETVTLEVAGLGLAGRVGCWHIIVVVTHDEIDLPLWKCLACELSDHGDGPAPPGPLQWPD